MVKRRTQRPIIHTVASFTAHFIPAPEGGYAVEMPALPGCLTQGDTFEEAEANAREAIQSYLASLAADGEPVPYDTETVLKRITVRIKTPRIPLRAPRL